MRVPYIFCILAVWLYYIRRSGVPSVLFGHRAILPVRQRAFGWRSSNFLMKANMRSISVIHTIFDACTQLP